MKIVLDKENIVKLIMSLNNWRFFLFVGLMMNGLYLKSQNSFQNDLFDTWELYHCELGDTIFEKSNVEVAFLPEKVYLSEKLGEYIKWKIPLLLYSYETDDYDWKLGSSNPYLIFDTIKCLGKNPEICSAYLYTPAYGKFSKTKVKYENGIIYQYYNDSKEIEFMLKKVSK